MTKFDVAHFSIVIPAVFVVQHLFDTLLVNAAFDCFNCDGMSPYLVFLLFPFPFLTR